MVRIKTPPKDLPVTKVMEELAQFVHGGQQSTEYLEYMTPTDNQGRYHPYDDFRYRVPKHLNTDYAWAFTRFARYSQSKPLDLPLNQVTHSRWYLTSIIQKAMTVVDRYATNGALELMSSRIGEAKQLEYLFKDLTEDEAISSSQLEGAATTTLVAKAILKNQRKPRSQDERMILGNFQMMRLAWKKRLEPLSPELIAEFHRIGVEGIDDEKYTPGHFRQTDDVVVEGPDGEVVHTPPPWGQLPDNLRALSSWANECHDNEEATNFVHPLVKAICLHFAIGFEHPFRDGNGRVARTLFYWFMFKSGYGALRYIAVSTLLKEAAARYAKSYIYTETDEMDLTYFVEYQCDVVMRAVRSFREAYDKALHDIREFNVFLYQSGLLKKLSDKQRMVFQAAQAGYATQFTINDAKENLGCAYNTAAASLNGLVDLKLFKKHKQGREWIYKMNDKAAIKAQWLTNQY